MPIQKVNDKLFLIDENDELITRCVYIINLKGTNFYKIGLSGNLTQRLKQIQSYNPLKIKLSVAEVFPYSVANKIEKRLHEKYKTFCVHGEWFEFESISSQDLRDSINVESNKLEISVE